MQEPRLCKRGHDLNQVGQTAQRVCRACERERDRARGAAKRRRRLLGADPDKGFKPGEGYLFDQRGFGWHSNVFETPGRLTALSRWMTKTGTHSWHAMAQHALSCLEDEGYDPWTYQTEFFPTASGGSYFASEEMMRTYWDFLRNPDAAASEPSAR